MNIRVADKDSSYYGETNRHLKVMSGEHIVISILVFKETKLTTKQFVAIF